MSEDNKNVQEEKKIEVIENTQESSQVFQDNNYKKEYSIAALILGISSILISSKFIISVAAGVLAIIFRTKR